MPSRKKSASKKSKVDKFKEVTDKLITLLEQGVEPWRKGWKSEPYQNPISGTIYKGGNPLICAIDCLIKDYSSPYFVSFKQASSMGWQVKKGSKATSIRWGGVASFEVEDSETGEKRKQFYNTAKWSNVFNLDCIDDSDSEKKIVDFLAKKGAITEDNPDVRMPDVETFIKMAIPSMEIKFGGDQAFYHPKQDFIGMPDWEDFSSAESYYATLLHEYVHATGHESRLARDQSGRFGSRKYAFEELIAEMGAAYVQHELGLNADIENHASYLDHWIKILKEDEKAFFKASKLATDAANHLIEMGTLTVVAA